MTARNGDSPATKADLETLRTEFKSDLKDEIRSLRTELKGDMESLRAESKSDREALRAELKGDNQSLKKELKGDIHRLSGAIVELQADMREVKSNMATKADINRIMSAIDSFAKRSEHYDRAQVLHGHALTEVDVTLKDHEKRLAHLESSK